MGSLGFRYGKLSFFSDSGAESVTLQALPFCNAAWPNAAAGQTRIDCHASAINSRQRAE